MVGAHASRALSDAWETGVRLADPEPLRTIDGHHKVARFRVVGAGPVGSVIVKRPSSWDSGTKESRAGHLSRLHNERAALEFLGPSGIAPRLLAADDAHDIVVIEDLGDGGGDGILLGDNALEARRYLLAWAATIGRMHAFSSSRRGEYDRIRGSLSSPLDAARTGEDDDHVEALARVCGAIGVPAPDGALSELSAAFDEIRTPGDFAAFVHGDPCPDNDRLDGRDGTVRLFDFEWGVFGHALTDGVYGVVPYPTCWCTNRLPDNLVDEIVAAYRAALAEGVAEAADDSIFVPALTRAWAAMAARTCLWSLSSALFARAGSWGISTNAQRVGLRLHRFARVAPDGVVPAFRSLAASLADRIGVAEEDMPLYPAFR